MALAHFTSLLMALEIQLLPAPLVHYLEAAKGHAHALGISRAQLEEQRAQVDQALAGLTPVLQLVGGYTRNQYAASFTAPAQFFGGPTGVSETIVITPVDQLNATIGLSVPLLTVGGYARLAEGHHAENASAEAERASEAEVQLAVARGYYQVVAAQGIRDAAIRALKTAQDAWNQSKAKLALGTANQLTVSKAQVDVARAQQTVAAAQRTLGLARRSLETLTGQTAEQDLPEPGVAKLPPRTEEEYVEAAQRGRPEVLQLRESLAQASAARTEAWSQFAPSIVGSAQEHLTNAAGFVGHEAYWTLGANLSWNLDPVGNPAAVRHANAVLQEQEERLAQELDTVRDDIHSAWLEIEEDRARLEETQSETQSSHQALAITQNQFQEGTATSLELSEAERDNFSAEANLSQAQSDLAAALLSLKKASGQSLTDDP